MSKRKRSRRKRIKKPRKLVNWTQFDELCAIQCTQEEIAAKLGMCADTLSARIKEEFHLGFSDIFRVKRQAGLISLRSKQFTEAMDGNTALLIFLGKNWLGQFDRHDLNVNLPNNLGQVFKEIEAEMRKEKKLKLVESKVISSNINSK